ncbi:unnamed protein product [Symbiodinium natans]|uniref:Metallo-beta-lactamase domain-containing protein n=1 Tax=Symbiodinium natans TaxID=878477 RepID=A0A812TR83_9DINO|nr:unnamed protein product [Symbiodinium natans]
MAHAQRCVQAPPPPGSFDAIVLGSGVSTAVPQLAHVLHGRCESASTAVRKDGLAVCQEAAENAASKNRRLNVSLLVRYSPEDGSRVRHIMIDAGKTMRQAALATLPMYGVKSIDALLLTHGHADAILGMDDLRDLQVTEKVLDEKGQHIGYRLADAAGPMQIISNKATLDRVREVFPYLHEPPDLIRPGVLRRRIAYTEFVEVSHDEVAIQIDGLPVTLFPVWHGGTYVSLGFAFGAEGSSYPLVYISDVKDVPPNTMIWLEAVGQRGIEVFIVDALARQPHPTHMSLDEALNLVRKLRPQRSFFVGMDSCAIGDHDEVNEELAALKASEGLDVQLAHDGLHLSNFVAMRSAENKRAGSVLPSTDAAKHPRRM